MDNLYFGKLKEDAIIPLKRDCDFGYDLYACFDEEYMKIEPGEIKIIPTGIISAFPKEYGCLIEERGSTGTRGLSVRAGVFDSNYHGEWLIPINNTTDKTIYIHKDYDKPTETIRELFYPYKKAIAQACFFISPKFNVEEKSIDFIKSIDSVRGEGRLGSSGK